MAKNSSKEYSVVFLVEGEKFNLGRKNSAIKFRRKVQICLVGSNSVGTPLEFAAFCSGFNAKYSRASAFCFFLSTTMVFTAFHGVLQHVHADRQLVTKKEISIKFNLKDDKKSSWPSGLISGFRCRHPGFGSQRG